ncbi:hypothetical protein B484DRAFT_433928, partial [Ochromonadaceae sp. CCMP2298]
MDTSQSSSSSSQHYSVLLQTVSELRTDLEKTMKKMLTLEEQNHTLKNNYTLVKDELIQTRLKYNEAKEGYLACVGEKFEAERQHEAFMDRLNVQLSEKKKQFEVLRGKLNPQDIDQLRVKVREEVEIEHKSQLQGMEYQLESARTATYAMRREYEKGKVEYEVLISHQQAEILNLRQSREEVEGNLRDQIVRLRDAELEPTKDDKLRSQRAQVAELTHLVELLREEAKSIRSERDEAIFSLESCKSSHQEVLVHLKGQLAVALAERDAMDEKTGHLVADAGRKEALLRSARQSAEEAVARLEACQKSMSDLEKSSAAARDDYSRERQEASAAFEAERAELGSRVDGAAERLAEREDALRGVQRALAEAVSRGESSGAEMRRAQQLQLQEARRKYASLEVQVADLRSLLKTAELEAEQRQDILLGEGAAFKEEQAKGRREKDLLQARLREAEAANDGERRKNVAERGEAAAAQRAMEGAVRGAELKSSSADAKVQEARDLLYDLQGQLQASNDIVLRLEAKNAQYAAMLEEVKKDFQLQVESIAPSYREQTDKLKKKMKAAMGRERKRADAYKSKCLEAHSK